MLILAPAFCAARWIGRPIHLSFLLIVAGTLNMTSTFLTNFEVYSTVLWTTGAML